MSHGETDAVAQGTSDKRRLCVLGLGNPGERYALTRHNVGFLVVDRLADILHVREFAFHINLYVAETAYQDWTVLLCKPWTYMNRCGNAVLVLLERFGIEAHEILVVHDDVQLPLGTLRLRRRGSSGGHNGLASVIGAYDSNDVPRLRCGVGFSSGEHDLADHVLSPFMQEDLPEVETMLRRASDAVFALIDHGWERAMNIYNTTPSNNQESL